MKMRCATTCRRGTEWGFGIVFFALCFAIISSAEQHRQFLPDIVAADAADRNSNVNFPI
jgi:hypothetical protein